MGHSAAPAELIIAGRIATLGGTSGYGWADAFAVAGGRVIATGRATEVDVLAGPRTQRWRLDDDVVVLPSFTDAHLHLVSAALAAGEPRLTDMDRDAALAAIAAAHRAMAERGDHNGWLTGHGWSFDALGGSPHRDWLDAVAPGRPVALWSHDHHARWLSDTALGRMRPHDLDRQSATIVRDEDGAPTGVLLEGAAGLVDRVVPGPTDDVITAALEAYAADLARLGVSGVHDPGQLVDDPAMTTGPALYRRLAERGQLPLRVVGSIREEQLDRAIEIGFRSGHAMGDRYRDGWIKIFADGALGSRTAFLSAPYEATDPSRPPPPRERGLELRDRAALRTTVRAAAAAGIASQIHAIGDAAVRSALDVLEAAPRVGSIRHRVEHAQLVRPGDVDRFGRSGIAASVQACHLLGDAASARSAWGPRTAWAFPLAALADGGALLPAGTDAPVEDPDPWRNLAAAVTRRAPGWPPGDAFGAEQALSMERALRSACVDPARTLGGIGGLTVGAVADGIIVERALIDASPDSARIAATRPLATLLDGALVHAAAGFEPS